MVNAELLFGSIRRGQRASRKERGLNRPAERTRPHSFVNGGFGSIATRATERQVRPRQLCRRKRKQSVSRSFIGQCRLMALLVGATEEEPLTNPARAAARLPIAPSPYTSGLVRFAISSREPRPRPGWRRPASRAAAQPCPTQPAPIDRPLTASTLLLPGGLFLRPFKLAAPPFSFVVESGFSFRNLIDGARGTLLRLRAFRLAGGFRWSAAAKIGG